MKKLTEVLLLLLVGSLMLTSFDGIVVFKQKEILAHWSQIIGNTNDTKDKLPIQMVGRFVIPNTTTCEAFVVVVEAAEESVQSIIPNARNFAEQDPNFQVTICQFTMGSNWKKATLLTQDGNRELVSFPGPYQVGRKHQDSLQIIGIGDTGCRDLDCGNEKGQNKKFAAVIENLVEKFPNPDFGVHVGDYRYLKGEDFVDTWEEWYLEFFAPAQPLLNNTPMIFIRGNHEQCVGTKKQKPDQYGRRWYQFFEPTTASEIHTCPKATASIGAPWYVDVAAKNTSEGQLGKQFRLVMIDNSPDEKHYKKTVYKQQVIPTLTANYKQAITWSDEASTTWWVMHKPLWYEPKGKELLRKKNQETKLALFEHALQDLNRVAQGVCKTKPCNIEAILSGHLHMYQYVDFIKEEWPDQYVLGHGGVDMEKKDLKEVKKEKDFELTEKQSGGIALPTYRAKLDLIYNKSGFLVWTHTQTSNWSVKNCLNGETNCRIIK